jgi:hypothetical protein
VSIFEEEERRVSVQLPQVYVNNTPTSRADIMRHNWRTGGHWYFRALESPTGLCTIFGQHIEPRFAVNAHFDHVVAPFWSLNASQVIEDRLKAKADYDSELRKAFEEAPI